MILLQNYLQNNRGVRRLDRYIRAEDKSIDVVSGPSAAGGKVVFIKEITEVVQNEDGTTESQTRYNFVPSEVTIRKGQYVIWINEDSREDVLHTITSGKRPELDQTNTNHAALFNIKMNNTIDDNGLISNGSDNMAIIRFNKINSKPDQPDNDQNVYHYHCHFHLWMNGKIIIEN